MTASPDDTGGRRAGGRTQPGAWQAVHIFYAASPRPLLLDCVRPLVDALTAEGLLSG